MSNSCGYGSYFFGYCHNKIQDLRVLGEKSPESWFRQNLPYLTLESEFCRSSGWNLQLRYACNFKNKLNLSSIVFQGTHVLVESFNYSVNYVTTIVMILLFLCSGWSTTSHCTILLHSAATTCIFTHWKCNPTATRVVEKNMT